MVRSSPTRIRLDELLVRRGLFQSRSRARDAILRGTVSVGGATAAKPGQEVAETVEVSVDDPAGRYVSRAALKLIAGIGAPLAGRLLMLDGRAMEWTEIRLPRQAACPVCGPH